MIPYIVFFIISIVLCYEGEQEYRRYLNYNIPIQIGKKNKLLSGKISNKIIRPHGIKKYYFWFSASVFVVSLLAGMRSYSVGTDVRVYGNNLFEYAQTVSLIAFIQKLPNIEPLYLTLVKFSTIFSSEPHILYFFTGIIIYSFIMAGFVVNGRCYSITLAWISFLFLLYGDTYNAMRQCLAISIAFWGFHFIQEKKYIRLILALVVAFFFHNSSIVMIVIVAIYLILQLNNKLWIKALMILGIIGGFYFFNELLTTFVGIGIFNSKMLRYQIGENKGLSVLAILIRLPFLIAIILQRNKFSEKTNQNVKLQCFSNNAEADFYILMLFLELFTVELSAFMSSLYRISLYFVPFRCMCYARIVSVQSKKNRIVYTIALVIYLLVIFTYQNAYKGNNEIYPYEFWFLE